MDKIATENLFLIEFLVDKVQLDHSNEVGALGSIICVTVQFFDNTPLDICEDDFCPKRKYTQDAECLKSGKSCLFSLTPGQAQDALSQFDVLVDIYKKMPQCLPERIQVGSSLISLANLFRELIKTLSSEEKCKGPIAKTLKDTFQITNLAGQTIGQLGMYMRMSCFGKLIVTQFQMNLEDKSVLFKDKEGHSLYKYKKIVGAGKPPIGDGIGSNTSAVLGVSSNYYASGCDSYGEPGATPITTGLRGGGYGGGGMSNPNCPNVPCGQQSQNQMQSSAPCNECEMPNAMPGATAGMDGCFDEIGASIRGNALKIRVHKENKVEEVDEDSCICGSGQMGNKGKSRGGYESGRGGYESGGGGCGAAGGGGGGYGSGVPPCLSAPEGTQMTEVSDPTKDVFILRIGKKSEGAEKKSNIELELSTPKGKDIKPPPKKETRETQCESCDFPDGGDKGKAGAKGGKGGKKGKK